MAEQYVKVKVVDDGTPIGTGFGGHLTHGTSAWLGRGSALSDPVLWNDTSLRYITAQQVRDHLDVSKSEFMVSNEARRRIAELKRKLLATYSGRLHSAYEVEQKPFPEGIPSQWGTIRVIVADNSPFVKPVNGDRWWWADWWWTEMGQAQIYIQTEIAEEISELPEMERNKQLLDTFRHEQVEMDDALRRAKAMYPGATQAQMTGLSQQFGGVAHIRAITEVEHQPNEAKYNKWFEKQLTTIGITGQDADTD